MKGICLTKQIRIKFSRCAKVLIPLLSVLQFDLQDILVDLEHLTDVLGLKDVGGGQDDVVVPVLERELCTDREQSPL